METLLAASTAYETGRSLGQVTLGVVLVALIRRIAILRRARRARLTDAVAALFVAALLIWNVVGLLGGDEDDPWKSGHGLEMKAGFLDGCRTSSGTFVDCGCAWEQLTSGEPYDTPDELMRLLKPMHDAQQSGQVSAVPSVLVSAFRSCRLSA